jgi:hypothetical protein
MPECSGGAYGHFAHLFILTMNQKNCEFHFHVFILIGRRTDIQQIFQFFLKNMNKKVLENSNDDKFAELQINQKMDPFSAETNLFMYIHFKIILLF